MESPLANTAAKVKELPFDRAIFQSKSHNTAHLKKRWPSLPDSRQQMG
jgi:hypothetical protein